MERATDAEREAPAGAATAKSKSARDTVELEVPASSIERMQPDYPPVLGVADHAATRGQHRAIRLTQVDIILVLVSTIIGIASAFVTVEPFKDVLSTVVAVAALVLLVEKSALGRAGAPHDWFQSRSVAEQIKSLAWRYMMRARPFNDDAAADADFLKALHEVLKTEGQLALDHGPTRVDEREITPYMRLVRSLPPVERRGCYLRLRLIDQENYYASRAEKDRRSGKQWRVGGWIFRAATFGFATLRIWMSSLGAVVGLFVTLAGIVATWSGFTHYDELAKSYMQASRALGRLQREMKHAQDEETVEKLVLEAEGVISQEELVWRLKRV